ncbi:hypothetical protein AAE478_010288 [Parahypoxylon ruwenzoriense]
MSSQLKPIVRCLQSVGSTSNCEGSLCLLSQTGGRLTEKIYQDEKVQEQRRVANDARPDTSAAYLVTEDQALALYINGSNQLKCSAFNQTTEKWKSVPLKGLGSVPVHPKSRVSAASTPDGDLVFYQATDGTIRSIVYSEKSWTEGLPVPGVAQVGTPLWAFSSDKDLVVAMLDEGGNVCCYVKGLKATQWTENVLPNSQFESPVTNMVVMQDTGFEAFVLSGTEVVRIGENESRVVLGSVSASTGEFEPSTAAESSIRIRGNNYGNITVNHYHYNYNYRSAYRHIKYGRGYGGGYYYYPPWYSPKYSRRY